MSQYTQNQQNEILSKFSGYLGFLGIQEPNLNKSHSDKLIFAFEDKEIQKYWVAFYTAYSFGYKHGRVYQANEDASDIINKINSIQ